MKRILFVVILFVLLACASDRVIVRPLCRHHAVACAAVAHEEGKEVYLSFGPVLRDGEMDWNKWHAQCYVMSKGEKKWLQMRNSGHCEEGGQDRFIVKKTFSMKEYLNYLYIK